MLIDQAPFLVSVAHGHLDSVREPNPAPCHMGVKSTMADPAILQGSVDRNSFGK